MRVRGFFFRIGSKNALNMEGNSGLKRLTGSAALSEPRAADAKSRILTTYGANGRSTHP